MVLVDYASDSESDESSTQPVLNSNNQHPEVIPQETENRPIKRFV